MSASSSVLVARHLLPLVAVLALGGCTAESHTEPRGQAYRRNKPAAPATSGGSPTAAPRAVEAAQAPKSEARAKLCLELDAPRPTVQLGEPVSLVASLVNCSSDVQQVEDLLAPELGFLQVWVRSPQSPERIHRSIVKLDARGKPRRTLAPGQRHSVFVPVYYGPDGWVMREPGPYRVRVEYGIESTRLESKPVEVKVLEPPTPADRRAAELMMTADVGMLLMTGRDDRGDGLRHLATVKQELPQSRLAPYARLAIAVAESRDGFDPKTKAFRTEGCTKATEELARTVPLVGNAQLAARGTASWIQCLRKANRDGDVDKAVSVFFRAHPDAQSVAAVTQSLERPSRKE